MARYDSSRYSSASTRYGDTSSRLQALESRCYLRYKGGLQVPRTGTGTPPHLGTVTLPLGTHLGRCDYSLIRLHLHWQTILCCPCIIAVHGISRYDTSSRYTSSYDSGRESPTSPYSVGRSVTSPTLGRSVGRVSREVTFSHPSGAPPPTAPGFPPTTHVGLVARSWRRRRMKRTKRGEGGEKEGMEGRRRW